jgi:hypothetical protein
MPLARLLDPVARDDPAQSGCLVAGFAGLGGSRIACRVQETLTEACAVR